MAFNEKQLTYIKSAWICFVEQNKGECLIKEKCNTKAAQSRHSYTPGIEDAQKESLRQHVLMFDASDNDSYSAYILGILEEAPGLLRLTSLNPHDPQNLSIVIPILAQRTTETEDAKVSWLQGVMAPNAKKGTHRT